ncbi:MAG: glycerophosphodiester phosphodiesterase [Zetaproteobacteria bacterium CG_4_9_14_3_um_filter_49_83]|nr:MAG: hypothetical protein AUJ56_00685 [Zetaproteobacteria bacterium CG1_02_49_23]PIQ31498.1 MAG: glycerophosphodiester phosphodiesterase [Zetaproteobacteria bacterium CG17_big_fil_post_rev_8_21_14_2_50_50_13]PIV29434.1 MAG: glycerophosphodiester phosphodiesterase [Zetaproteobacteria bacterium CG02_land_8_20_14_3_00_50_9]PIY54623.1 MAG: glycerophosphodiester phosphodiesterase [Zetaproteobacteria bacterium CG_4_10_14_0_8_um_filter_49_80]PJA35647.1 MAG: glycerophosphodiester phosphodiesterase [
MKYTYTKKIVAHRGDHENFRENSMAAFRHAAAAGALFAECDIQFTRDFVAVVVHDDDLRRLFNVPLHLSQLDWLELQTRCELPLLSELLTWLEETPALTCFIEIKPDIRQRLSSNDIASRLAQQIPAALVSRIVLISQSGDILDACHERLACAIGWVMEEDQRPACRFDYIFMPYSEAHSLEVWQQQGVKVGLYTVNDAALARQLIQQGAELIETDHFSRMLTELEQRYGND